VSKAFLVFVNPDFNAFGRKSHVFEQEVALKGTFL